MAKKSILVISLVLSPSPTTSAMQAAVGAAIKRASEVGYRVESYGVNTADFNPVQDFRNFLRGRTWEGVMIGWGIRGMQEHTELFEKLVNVVLADVTPTPKFIFSTNPNGFVNAIQRVLGNEI